MIKRWLIAIQLKWINHSMMRQSGQFLFFCFSVFSKDEERKKTTNSYTYVVLVNSMLFTTETYTSFGTAIERIFSIFYSCLCKINAGETENWIQINVCKQIVNKLTFDLMIDFIMWFFLFSFCIMFTCLTAN